MCGIFGIWNRRGDPIDLQALRAGVESLRHRGPDDEGYLLVDTRGGAAVACGGRDTHKGVGVPPLEELAGRNFDLALGFRRLSILDLTPAGHQPMQSADGRFWIVFNGEIYNYLELRAELEGHGHTFRTNTDTEVILAAYERWYTGCLPRFNGMWAFAIWDNARRVLLLARDRFGVKPCYLADLPRGGVAFASEIKALRASGVARCQPRSAAVGNFVTLGTFPSHRQGETFFEDVRSLPPSHVYIVGQNNDLLRPYWQIPAPEPRPLSESVVEDGFRRLLIDSIRLRLRADVPLGTCLSGGLDSSVIVGLVRQLMESDGLAPPRSVGPRQHTFSAVYDSAGEWNERIHVDRVLAHTRACGHFVVPSGDGLWNEIEEVLAYQDEPVQSSAIFAQWCVMRLAREQGVTVLLDGQGADELLGGYRPYQTVLQEHLARFGFLGAWRMAGEIQDVSGEARLALLAASANRMVRAGARRWLSPLGLRRSGGWARKVLAEAGLNAACADGVSAELSRAAVEAAESQQASLDAQLRYQMLEESLPNLLRYEDRNSMAFSIEARVPFLDYRLVEFVFRHAGPFRFRGGWTKWPLRRCAASLLPAEIAWRRDKVGYDVPEIHWLLNRRSQVVALLAETEALGEYVDVPFVCKRTGELLERGAKRDGRRVWRWLNTALWLRSLDDSRTGQSASVQTCGTAYPLSAATNRTVSREERYGGACEAGKPGWPPLAAPTP